MKPKTVIFSPHFEANLADLRRRYRHVFKDIDPLISQLEQGDLPGNQISGVGYQTYKVRVANSSAQRGKSGGFRVIYYVQLADRVILLTIYSKTDQSDIAPEKIRQLVESLLPPD